MQVQQRIQTSIKDESKLLFQDLLDKSITVSEYDSRQIKVATGTVDADIDLAGVSNVSFLMITSTQPISCKLNGSLVDTSKGTLFIFSGSSGGYISSLSISNDSGSEANLKIILGG